ncbi:MAG: HAD hydrolase-like protein [Clostridiales bacterium]|nr:HAD hydrolase-like protein [Clostridiales bacterium]
MFFCFKRLIPNRVCDRLSEFPFGELREQGFEYAFLDLDNTIASDRSTEPSEYSFQIIKSLKEAGFVCCLVSNAISSRSARFAQALDISYIDYAGKPSPKGIFKAIELVGASAEKTVFFGDQIFTDILAANRAGVYSVLVEPYDRREVFYVRLKRLFEYIVRKACRF